MNADTQSSKTGMFTVQYRDQVKDYVLQRAASDERVVAGAIVGSLALGEGDRWSDLDLTFAVAGEVPLNEVLEDWTRKLVEEFRAVHLFDLPSGPSIYRVFLLPGCLQFDLSFTPESSFGAAGPMFKLLFGRAVERPFAQPPSAADLFGYGVHHALRARFCIERGRYWQAVYWINATRDYAMSLACRRLGLPAVHGRGFDALPPEVRNSFANALVHSLEREELLRALGQSIDALLREAVEVREQANQAEPELRKLSQSWES